MGLLVENLKFNKENINVKESVNFILDRYKESNKEEVVLVNIGTDKHTGDIFGPLFGSVLEEKGTKLSFYGTLENPIHALNIKDNMNKINLEHPNAFIIAIDACLGEDTDLVVFRNKPLSPGKGIGKDLGCIGDISIIFIVYNNPFDFCSNSIHRVGDSFKAAKELYKVIHSLEKKIIISRTRNLIEMR